MKLEHSSELGFRAASCFISLWLFVAQIYVRVPVRNR